MAPADAFDKSEWKRVKVFKPASVLAKERRKRKEEKEKAEKAARKEGMRKKKSK